MAANFPKWFPFGFRLINGQALSSWFNNPQSSYEDAITAKAGGGRASAYQLSALISRISVCATNADSVKLPAATGTGNKAQGSAYTVINDGAANLAVFPQSATGTIDGGGAGASVTISAGNRADFYSVASDKWVSAGASKAS